MQKNIIKKNLYRILKIICINLNGYWFLVFALFRNFTDIRIESKRIINRIKFNVKCPALTSRSQQIVLNWWRWFRNQKSYMLLKVIWKILRYWKKVLITQRSFIYLGRRMHGARQQWSYVVHIDAELPVWFAESWMSRSMLMAKEK